MKICKECGKEKSLDDFYKNKRMKDGYVNQCKACDSVYWKKRRDDPKTGGIIRKRKNEYQKRMYHTDSTYRLKILKQGKESTNRNRERVRKYHQEWNKRPEVMSRKRIRERKSYQRYKYNIAYKLKKNIRTSVWQSLNRRQISKNGACWEKIVGYSRFQLKYHLEQLFVGDMSWDNYGNKWHIDHIIPCSFFEYKNANDVEFKMCWRLENLQPLWASENHQKSNKIIKVA